MVRTLITIDDKELAKLDRLAKKQKKSRAQLMREALSQYVRRYDNEKNEWQQILKGVEGLWAHKNIDTDKYLEEIRKDWDR